jgi:hypothetical protein
LIYALDVSFILESKLGKKHLTKESPTIWRSYSFKIFLTTITIIQLQWLIATKAILWIHFLL